MNESLNINTPYGLLQIPAGVCAGVSFEDYQSNKEMIVTENFNRLTGIVTDSLIHFKVGTTGETITIRKEKIRYILLKNSPAEKGTRKPSEDAVLFVMSNGDLLTGKPENPSITLKTGLTRASIAFDEIQSIDINAVRAEVKKNDGTVLRGQLLREEMTLTLDLGVSVKGVYQNRFFKIFPHDGLNHAVGFFHQGLPSRRNEIAFGDEEHLINSLGMKFQRVHPGSFMMGSEEGRFDERPAHRVTLTQTFYLSIHEVTQDVWEKIMGTNPSRFKGPKRPVENISWYEIQEFCRKLSAAEGVHYRLPTEAEWEFACRAGTATEYYWGDEFEGDYAWCWFNSGGETQPVGLKKPNPWGLYDMLGNVGEWCEDGFGLYRSGEQVDPKVVSGSTRTLRGGGWDSHPEICRSASRLHLDPADRSDAFGFRIVRTP